MIKRIFLILLASLLFQSQALALSQAELESIYNGTIWYDPNSGSGGTCDNFDLTISNNLPSSVPANYASLLTQAGATYNVNPQFLAAIFLSENGNVWKPFDTAWATSPAGASGPFQFMPGTWDSYKVDGNNDGKTDISDIFDAAFSASNMMSQNNVSVTTPLGSISKPFKPGTFLYFTATYNWGSGNVQMHTNANSPITVAPTETQNYLNNVYTLITSGFTKSGNPDYGDPSGSGGSSGSSGSTVQTCSGGIVSGNVAQTALGLAWPQPPDAVSPPRDPLTPTQAYTDAVQKYFSNAPYSGADCGAFIGIVMHASQADTNYPLSGTAAQESYVESHPEKYTVLKNVQSTADLQAGDILIVNSGSGAGADGHTFIYVGLQAGGYNEASASMAERMPSLGAAPANLQDPLGRGHFIVARLK